MIRLSLIAALLAATLLAFGAWGYLLRLYPATVVAPLARASRRLPPRRRTTPSTKSMPISRPLRSEGR